MESLKSVFDSALQQWESLEPKWPVYAGVAAVGLYRLRKYFAGGVCNDTADLTGKTVFITGASAGIGIPTAKILAKMGKPQIVMAVRDLKKGEAVRQQIIKETGNENIQLIECDLSDFESIKNCAKSVDTASPPINKIDLLILNAGLIASTRRITKQGHEVMMGTMHFGHALLTHLLLPKVAPGARIVFVNSTVHKWGKIDFSDMHSERSFDSLKAYGTAKLASLHFARALAKYLRNQGSDITVNNVHPGVIATELSRESHAIIRWAYKLVVAYFGKTVEQGAQTTIYAAISPDLKDKTGLYLADCRPEKVAKHVTEEMDQKVWDWTLQTLGIKQFGKQE